MRLNLSVLLGSIFNPWKVKSIILAMIIFPGFFLWADEKGSKSVPAQEKSKKELPKKNNPQEKKTFTVSMQTEKIKMRDGIGLNTKIFIPNHVDGKMPILFMRTPYGIRGFNANSVSAQARNVFDDDFIFVVQDIRGLNDSEGEFRMSRPPRTKKERENPKAIDESTDAYDTIEWLIHHLSNNNGNVGMLGVSYPGWLTMMASLDPHPALKAISAEATMGDVFMGDDFYHNGAFRLSYAFEYAYMMESAKKVNLFQFDKYDTYEWYLKLGSLSNVNPKYFHGKIPTWNDFVAHPNYDDFWQNRALAKQIESRKIPILHVAGWYDQEDFYGPLTAFEKLEKLGGAPMNCLVVGPWNHGGWSQGPGNSLGKINFGSPAGKYFREKIRAPWFKHWLKGEPLTDFPKVQLFQTGSNRWVRYENWPPKKEVITKNLYFQANGKLAFTLPEENQEILKNDNSTKIDSFDRYRSDPAHPVPYRQRPIEPTYYPPGSGWYTWLTEDQRLVHLRDDILSWETDPLVEDITVTGKVFAQLFAATSGSDSDWIVKLIDVLPENNPTNPKQGGYQLIINTEVFRGRFRKSMEKPEPLIPNQIYDYSIDLHGCDHCFKKGHKIMVQVQSSLFPLVDRNPQKFVENIFQAKDSDFIVTEQKIYRSPKYPSHLSLPVQVK